MNRAALRRAAPFACLIASRHERPGHRRRRLHRQRHGRAPAGERAQRHRLRRPLRGPPGRRARRRAARARRHPRRRAALAGPRSGGSTPSCTWPPWPRWPSRSPSPSSTSRRQRRRHRVGARGGAGAPASGGSSSRPPPPSTASPTRSPIDEDAPAGADQPLRPEQARRRAGAGARLPQATAACLRRPALLQRLRRRRRARRGPRPREPPHPARPARRSRAASSSQVFGDDYPTPDGTCVRDYVHVVDLAEAHSPRSSSAGGRAPSTSARASATPCSRSLAAVEAPAASRCGARGAAPPRRPRRAGRLSSARRVLGWRPQHTLGDAVADAWAWMCAHPVGYTGQGA